MQNARHSASQTGVTPWPSEEQQEGRAARVAPAAHSGADHLATASAIQGYSERVGKVTRSGIDMRLRRGADRLGIVVTPAEL